MSEERKYNVTIFVNARPRPLAYYCKNISQFSLDSIMLAMNGTTKWLIVPGGTQDAFGGVTTWTRVRTSKVISVEVSVVE